MSLKFKKNVTKKMNTIRIGRGVCRIQPKFTRSTILRRGYADTVSDKIKLTLALPHQVRFIFLETHRRNLTDNYPTLVYIQISRCVRNNTQSELSKEYKPDRTRILC